MSQEILSNVKKVISDFKSEKSVFYTTLNVCTNELLIDKINDLLTHIFQIYKITYTYWVAHLEETGWYKHQVSKQVYF